MTLQRVRVRFGRGHEAIFVTHLEQIELIKKTFLASPWPVAKSEGRRARPRISFGPAISVGYLSESEYCDVELNSRFDLDKAGGALAPHLPSGYELLQIKSIPRFFPSLEETLNLAHFRIQSQYLAGTLPKWEEFWKKGSFFVTKKKEDREVAIDARPLVKSWQLENGELNLFLRFGPGRTLKPEKVVQAVCGFSDIEVKLGLGEGDLKVNRRQLYFEKDNGVLSEP